MRIHISKKTLFQRSYEHQKLLEWYLAKIRYYKKRFEKCKKKRKK